MAWSRAAKRTAAPIAVRRRDRRANGTPAARAIRARWRHGIGQERDRSRSRRAARGGAGRASIARPRRRRAFACNRIELSALFVVLAVPLAGYSRAEGGALVSQDELSDEMPGGKGKTSARCAYPGGIRVSRVPGALNVPHNKVGDWLRNQNLSPRFGRRFRPRPASRAATVQQMLVKAGLASVRHLEGDMKACASARSARRSSAWLRLPIPNAFDPRRARRGLIARVRRAVGPWIPPFATAEADAALRVTLARRVDRRTPRSGPRRPHLAPRRRIAFCPSRHSVAAAF